jgi:putative transposase
MILIRHIVYVWTDNPGQIRQTLSGREKSGDSQMAAGPGSVFQADATPGDVYLVSSRNRNSIIGRPIIYFIHDETNKPTRDFEST